MESDGGVGEKHQMGSQKDRKTRLGMDQRKRNPVSLATFEAD